jgi:hypothetical protein
MPEVPPGVGVFTFDFKFSIRVFAGATRAGVKVRAHAPAVSGIFYFDSGCFPVSSVHPDFLVTDIRVVRADVGSGEQEEPMQCGFAGAHDQFETGSPAFW